MYYYQCYYDDASGKESPASAGDTKDTGSIPGSVRSLGVENDSPLQECSVQFSSVQSLS